MPSNYNAAAPGQEEQRFRVQGLWPIGRVVKDVLRVPNIGSRCPLCGGFWEVTVLEGAVRLPLPGGFMEI